MKSGLRCLCTALAVLLLSGGAHAEGRRVALVIGNASYRSVDRLANPGNDAGLIAQTVKGLGFTLVGGAAQLDLDRAGFERAVQAFGREIQGAEVVLFYYAGHGMQVRGTNWLVPVDAAPAQARDVDFQLVDAELVLRQMDGAGTRLNVMILDACRNNPFAVTETRGGTGGLAQMRAPEGTLISFATQPGAVAADGAGANGPYALALAATMRTPGLDIFKLFNRVGLTVKQATGGAQLPWVSSSPIDGEFTFAAAEGVPEAAPVAVTSAPVAVAPSAAVAALRGLADKGDAQAELDLGLALSLGQGVPQDYVAARQWLERAAAHGSSRAQYYVGNLFERGLGTSRSYATAALWYRRAAEQGELVAQTSLARLLARGLGAPRDSQEAQSWYLRAAEKGYAPAQYALGELMLHGEGADKAAAFGWFLRAAEQGHVSAKLQAGLMLSRGDGVAQNYGQALRWFREAAEAGSALAMNAVGVAYKNGHGVGRDYAQAMRWFRPAAEQGNVFAAYNLGVMYGDGLGVAKDPAVARQWLERSAAGGHEPAVARLARGGEGRPRAIR